MPDEIVILALGAVLLVIHIQAAIRVKTRQYGMAWNMGPRDAEMPEPNPVVGRLERARDNFLETLPIAIIALFGVVLADKTSDTTAIAGWTWLAARPLDGASLAAYRELERRISVSEPEWSIRLRPPARPLPSVDYDGEDLTEDGARALGLIAWAGQRVGVPIVLGGPEAQVELAATRLEERGVTVRRRPGAGGSVTAAWAAPDQ